MREAGRRKRRSAEAAMSPRVISCLQLNILGFVSKLGLMTHDSWSAYLTKLPSKISSWRVLTSYVFLLPQLHKHMHHRSKFIPNTKCTLLHLFVHIKIILVLRCMKKAEPCMHNALRLHIDAEQVHVKLHSAPPPPIWTFLRRTIKAVKRLTRTHHFLCRMSGQNMLYLDRQTESKGREWQRWGKGERKKSVKCQEHKT